MDAPETPKDRSSLPVIYMAFSNDQNFYLESLRREAKVLFDTLYPLHAAGLIETISEQEVDVNDLFTSFRRFRNRITIFHYGGHADDQALRLEGQQINATGLAQLFSTEQEHLQLVFLNGCSTKDQVQGLLDRGVPVVIGTNVNVTDDSAFDFAKMFYEEMASGSTIQTAFNIASAFIKAKYGDQKKVETVTRSLQWEEAVSEKDEFPWGLFYKKGQEEQLQWRLVEPHEVSQADYASLTSKGFEKAEEVTSKESYELNQYLNEPIRDAIFRWDPVAFDDIYAESPNPLRDSNAYPLPIMHQLSYLLEEKSDFTKLDFGRLTQLIITYQESCRFLAYVSLAQLAFIIDEKQSHLSTSKVLLTRFLSLNESQSITFDYLKLAGEIDAILRDHEIEPRLGELDRLLTAFKEKEDLDGVHAFMMKLMPLTINQDQEIDNIDLLCRQAEYCLGKLLVEMAFLVRYELVSIYPEAETPRKKSKKEKASEKSSDTLVVSTLALPFSRHFKISGERISAPAIRLINRLPDNWEQDELERNVTEEQLSDTLNLSHFFLDQTRKTEGQPDLFIFHRQERQKEKEYKLLFRNLYFSYIEIAPQELDVFDLNKLLEINKVRAPQKRFRYANYNSDAPDGEDHLDIMPDVRAFANLIASRDLKPPLSIGLFGDWGSGKSFFLSKLRQEVEQYEKKAKQALALISESFIHELKNTAQPKEQYQIIHSLFPKPASQIKQIQDWIKKWEKRRDPYALRCLGRVFGKNPYELEQLMLQGKLKTYTAEDLLIKKLAKSQEEEANKLVEGLHQNTSEALTLIRTLKELNDEKALGYCRNIAQIEFNAWHYTDTNLWASMVTNILEDLNTYVGNLRMEDQRQIELYKNLATTHQMREEVGAEIRDINTEIENINDRIETLIDEKVEAEQNLKNTRLIDALTLLEESDDHVASLMNAIRKKGQEACEKVGLQKFNASLNNAEKQVKTLRQEVQATWTRLSAWWESFRSLGIYAKSIFLFLLAGPVLAVGILPILFENFTLIDDLINQIGLESQPFFQRLIPLIALIADLAIVGQKMLKKINEAGGAVDQAFGNLEQLQQMASVKQRKEIELEQTRLEQKEQQLKAALQRRTENDKRLKELRHELKEIEDGKRLSAFIEKRLLSNDYQRHLGVISLIRRDFEQLTTYLHDSSFYAKVVARIQDLIDQGDPQKQTNGFDLEKIDTIDRIVLYIDDLDRCPPDKVVQVLQAIHLILAFPLFVVVVGVDVRWISRSLAKEYGAMLLEAEPEQEEKNNGIMTHQHTKTLFHSNATPFDYLEKVFQLPFQLKNMSDASKEYYIGKLLEGDMKSAQVVESASDVTEPAPSPGKETTHEKDKADAHLEKEEASQPKVDQGADKKPKEGSGQTVNRTEHAPAESPKDQQRLERVTLSLREIAFIKAMSPILGNSPRTVKRFVNVCRLIKSHADWGKQERVPGHTISRYEMIIFILSLVTGIPTFTRYLFEHLDEEKSDQTFQELIDQVNGQLEQLSKNRKPVLVNNLQFDYEELMKEWRAFQSIWGLSESHHRLIPEEDENRQLIEDFCSKKVKEIRPLFGTAVRFSFRFTEY